MIIRCWGSRGSIPVSGKDFLKYGGDTTCIEIRNRQDDIIIIDAGSGIRNLGNALLDEGRSHFHLLFTHAHWDHLLGFPFFKPIYRSGMTIDLYGCAFARESIEALLAAEMAAPHFPVPYDHIAAEVTSKTACSEPFCIGGLKISPILISHPNQGIGFKFEEGGKSFVFLTDNELDYQHEQGLTRTDYHDFIRGADVLFHDAEYTRKEYERTRSWGHSMYEDVLDLACEANVGMLGLFHHNQERTDTQIDEIVHHCQDILSERDIPMECFGVATGTEIHL